MHAQRFASSKAKSPTSSRETAFAAKCFGEIACENEAEISLAKGKISLAKKNASLWPPQALGTIGARNRRFRGLLCFQGLARRSASRCLRPPRGAAGRGVRRELRARPRGARNVGPFPQPR